MTPTDRGQATPPAGSLPKSVAGHEVLDFVNTEIVSQGDTAADVLRSPETFHAWCVYAGIGDDGMAAPASTASAAELRSALRSIMESLSTRERPPAHAIATLQAFYADAIAHAIPTVGEGPLTWTWDPSTSRAPAARLASSAVELLSHGRTDRIKMCPNCGFVFYDETKNGSRRWCSMDDCGTEVKMRRYVAKRAQRSADA